MSWIKRCLMVAGALTFGAVLLAPRGYAESPAQKIFLSNNCNKCHSISALHIARKPAEEEGRKAPDLSKVGSEQNAAFIKGFLLRQESLHGKKHMKKWTGSEAELDQLTKFLSELK